MFRLVASFEPLMTVMKVGVASFVSSIAFLCSRRTPILRTLVEQASPGPESVLLLSFGESAGRHLLAQQFDCWGTMTKNEQESVRTGQNGAM